MAETTVPPTAPDEDPLDQPKRIGRYRILQVLGEGGMGVVYEAEQTMPVRRRVALKVMKVGMDTKEVIARFEAERQALAVMSHPGIAKVLDAGASKTGRPFFAMELVKGVPITDYCDTRRSTTRERLELFIPVCHAMQHAHQKGVIHRDLKPSNVLVTETDGRPTAKIIDFGIAKAVGQRLTDRTLVTAYGQAMGTPAYMSPEQAEMSGLDVDTRADVYSLGVLLYELLVGALPVDPHEVGLQSFIVQLVLRETDPPTPSARVASLGPGRRDVVERRRTDHHALRRQLRGDLDWIVMRAMDKDRARRYETANGLAMDLKRFLNDEPVVARPPSATYRFGKFVKRHRVGVSAAAAVALSILLSSGIITSLAVEATRARAEANQRRAQAEDLISFMVGDLRRQLEPIGQLKILDTVADKALEYFGAVPEATLSDEELFRRSEALNQVGQVRMAQGNLDAALEAFDESLRLALALGERDPDNGEWQVGLGASHFYVGYVHWLREELDPALEHMEAYLAVAQRLVETDPDNAEWQLELGYAYSNIGSLREAEGNLRGALEALEATLTIKETLAERDPENLDRQLDLANGYNKVGVVLRKLGDLDSALQRLRADHGIRERLARSDTSNITWTEGLATSHWFLGGTLDMLGEVDSGRYHYGATVAIYERLTQRDPENVDWMDRLASSKLDLAQAMIVGGDLEAAGQEVSHATAIYDTLLERDADRAEWRRGRAETRRIDAEILLESEQLPAAAEAADAAVAELAALVGSSDRARLPLARSLIRLGTIRERQGQPEGADSAWQRAIATVADAPDRDRPSFRAVEARALIYLGRVGEALPLVQALIDQGYREVEFTALARERGVWR